MRMNEVEIRSMAVVIMLVVMGLLWWLGVVHP